MNKKKALAISTGLGICVGLFRFIVESRMPALVPYDAQGGIWIVYGIITGGLTFAFVGFFSYYGLLAFAENRKGKAVVFGILVIAAIGWTSNRIIELERIGVALADAKNPDTDPARLKELIGYETGFGYEIDNRLASNPNSPVELLRKLHGKPYQQGTEMCLARNPNTPDDILMELMKSEDKWIQESLQSNPRYTELKAHPDGAINSEAAASP
tara:strand:+ start:1198 stop:1836 length:639 start_codon:yes stop_codon:yes gene_type:complete